MLTAAEKWPPNHRPPIPRHQPKAPNPDAVSATERRLTPSPTAGRAVAATASPDGENGSRRRECATANRFGRWQRCSPFDGAAPGTGTSRRSPHHRPHASKQCRSSARSCCAVIGGWYGPQVSTGAAPQIRAHRRERRKFRNASAPSDTAASRGAAAPLSSSLVRSRKPDKTGRVRVSRPEHPCGQGRRQSPCPRGQGDRRRVGSGQKPGLSGFVRLCPGFCPVGRAVGRAPAHGVKTRTETRTSFS